MPPRSREPERTRFPRHRALREGPFVAFRSELPLPRLVPFGPWPPQQASSRSAQMAFAQLRVSSPEKERRRLETCWTLFQTFDPPYFKLRVSLAFRPVCEWPFRKRL